MKLFFILLFLPFFARTQNLLLNSGFEEENICSEYKINCAPEAWIYTVPSFNYYFKDAQEAHSGEHFVALIAGHAKKAYHRTFVRSRLLCGLQKGKTYRLQFFVKSDHPILDSVGIYFSDKDLLFETRTYQRISPTLYLHDALQKPVRNDTNWQQVIFDYKATGKEIFLSLGNFSKRDITGPTGIEQENYFFVLFDDVSLSATDPNERLCADWQKNREDIYGEDERHEYLEKLIRRYRGKAPAVVPLKSTVTVKVDTVVIPDVLFATNSFVMSKQSLKIMDSLTKKLNGQVMDSIIVEGHTDYRGDAAYNKELSWRRANAVSVYLQRYFATRIISRGFGSEKPVADNRTPAGRQQNRRVEVFFYTRQ